MTNARSYTAQPPCTLELGVMRIRERFKRFRGKFKEALALESSPTASISSLPGTQTNLVPDSSLRARSHSPVPLSGAQLILPPDEPQIKTGEHKAQSSTPLDIVQAAHLSGPHTAAVPRSPTIQEASSSTRPIIESGVKYGDNTVQLTGSLPEIQDSAPIPNPIPTTILRSPDDSRNAIVPQIVAPPGPSVTELSNDLGLASPDPFPTPNLNSTPARDLQNDIPATDNSITQDTCLLSTVRDSSSEAEPVPRSLDVAEQNNEKPLDINSLPQAISTAANTSPGSDIKRTHPELDARVISQVTAPTLEPAHEDTDDTSHSILDPQTILSTVTTSLKPEITVSGSDSPFTSTPVPAKTISTLADSAWKSFNGFRRVLGGISNEVGPLKLVMDQLSGLIGMYEDAANARMDYVALRTELEELFSILSTHFSGNAPPAMTAGMNNLCTAIENELDRISTKEGRQMARRLLQADQDIDDVMKCYRRVKAHLERLKLNADLSMWKIVDEQATETRLKSLVPSLAAFYNSSAALQVGRRECTPETRKKVLASLSHWRHDKSQGNMYWLNGMAGTGKTTIANSLCVMLDQSHELGASFFCTRLLPECRDVNAILPTIAYQLARFSRPFRHFLSQALEADPDLQAKALPNQLHGLIVGPLRKASSTLPEDLVVVIDALDECVDGQAVSLLLEILAENIPDLPLKVFVSSRPEPQIRHRIGDIKSKLVLHDLEASIVKEDIRLYLQTELERLSTIISDLDLSTLVERAGVLFIYAATVVRYVRAGNSPFRRQKRIQAIIEMDSQDPSRTNSDIDALYNAILVAAFDSSELDAGELSNMRMVLDTVVCAQEPLTVKALTGLLGLEATGLVEDALEPLRSVLNVSGDDDLVNTLHASFPDYMLNPARSKQHGCQSQIHHGRLAEVCLDRIDRNECQFNICGLESSYLFDEDVSDLDKRMAPAIPQDLWYACRYWPLHLKQGGRSAERLERILKFVKERLLLWMEVLNLKKHIHVGALAFEKVERWCEEEGISQQTKYLIHDAWRFITMFATNDVSRSTVHLYVSMLASWPRMKPEPGLLTYYYMGRANGLATVGGTAMARRHLAVLGVLSTGSSVKALAFSLDGTRIASGSNDGTIWLRDAQTFKPLLNPFMGHTESVNSVAFSPNGMLVLSGSDDCTIRVWDAQTGKSLLGPLKGHAMPVNSVVFSPDGLRIVSGSNDCMIRVWDAQTGNALPFSLKGHTGWVKSVAYSPNGTRIISGSHDCTIRVWDALAGNPLLGPLQGDFGWINSVAFSPDGMRIVSGSEDSTVRVWDAQTGEPLLDPLRGHISSVKSVAFSPDGMRITSGSDNGTLRVWDTHTGRPLLEPLTGHTKSVNWVAFSPDGMRAISGSDDSTIRVWDAQMGKPLLDPLEGHMDLVNSIAFSPDGVRLVSGSWDRTIQLWEAQTGKLLLDPLTGHTGSVESVGFSPDGKLILSGSRDTTIRLWNAQTGEPFLGPLWGHTDLINSVAFSPVSMCIASGSDDRTVRLWDALTGKPLLDPLKGHDSWVSSIEFSPNGLRIVSGSYDFTVRVWDVQTGNLLLGPLEGHTEPVESVTFSPDGTQIASGSHDYTIRLWDAQTGKALLSPLKGHTDMVNSVAFSPDGMYIASGSCDKTIRVWSVQTGSALLSPLEGHTGWVKSVAWSPDGTHIVSGSYDKAIRMWNLDGLVARNTSAAHPLQDSSSYWTLDERGWDERYGHPLSPPPPSDLYHYSTFNNPGPPPSSTPNPYPQNTPNPYPQSHTPNPYPQSHTPNPYPPSQTPNPYPPTTTPGPYQQSPQQYPPYAPTSQSYSTPNPFERPPSAAYSTNSYADPYASNAASSTAVGTPSTYPIQEEHTGYDPYPNPNRLNNTTPGPSMTSVQLQDDGYVDVGRELDDHGDTPLLNPHLKLGEEEEHHEDENNIHYGAIPQRQPRRYKTIKKVPLYHGNFVVDTAVPSKLLDMCALKNDREFTHMRYTAATCDPNDFLEEKYTLRQRLYDPPRRTELFIVMTMYNEDEQLFTRTMHGVMQNIKHLCERKRSKMWADGGWKRVVVCIVSDGRMKINSRTLSTIAAMGAYQDGIAKNIVDKKPVTAHIYEYTTQISVTPSMRIEGAERGTMPCQIIFCLKEKNQKKINSHRWFFNAFGRVLEPNVCVLLDVGTRPGPTSIYHLWKAFDLNSNVGGACGEIVADKGKFGKNLLNPLVAAQNFEYKMSNILDKPLESVFGYITVLPGAFSAYRYIALQNDTTGEGPLQKYFLGEKMHGADADIFTANMYLAEDRILCWELVSKLGGSWTLHYVKSAYAVTDVPDQVPELVSQRRRWLNGSFFAAIHSTVKFNYLYRSSHSFTRKLWIHVELFYQTFNLFFSWFSLGNYYIAFVILTQSMEGLGPKAIHVLNVILNYFYLGMLTMCFLLALGNRPQGSKFGYTMSFIGFALITIYMTFAAFFLAVRSIQELSKQNGPLTFGDFFTNSIFRNVILSIAATLGLYIVASLLFLEPWHMITSFIQYLLMAPSYINVLNVYAFANVHDVSWGTKGDNKVSTDLGVVATGKDKATVEASVPTDQRDINAAYEDAMAVLNSKPPVVEQKRDAATKQEDYYRSFRTNVLLSWTLSNGLLAAVVTSATKTNTAAVGGYMAFILFSVAGLAAFRFIGSTAYMIIRLFAGE